MNKFTAFLLIVLFAPILAGIYGILHDQITYTFSDEYYTKFKFVQFGLEHWGMGQNIGTAQAPEIQLSNPRLGVAIVGFLATWWVGLIIGILLAFLGLFHKDGKTMFGISIKAILLTICTTLSLSIIGLVYAKFAIMDHQVGFALPLNLNNPKDFLYVGFMHNFSYIGGAVAMILGLYYSFMIRVKQL